MKICPYCKEEIHTDAVKCRYCHEFLDDTRRPAKSHFTIDSARDDNPLPWYLRTGFMIGMLITLPPFVLPSVWLHPKLHLAWKITITVVVIALCWLTYTVFNALLYNLSEASKMLEEIK